MKKREKIILVLALSALLYGALDYFIFSSNKNNPLQPEKETSSSGLIEKINSTLAGLNIIEQKKPHAEYMISMIESDWKNDPFLSIKKGQNKGQESAKDRQMAGLMYSGFIKLGNKMLAVIDGMEYTTGEAIKDSGYKIIQITPESVLIKNNVNKKIVLYLNEG